MKKGREAKKEEPRKIFDAYVDAGDNFIDTAKVYGEGTSERYVGDFVSPDRDRSVVATKYTSDARGAIPMLAEAIIKA